METGRWNQARKQQHNTAFGLCWWWNYAFNYDDNIHGNEKKRSCGETFMVILRPEELCSCASTKNNIKKNPTMAAAAIVYKFMTNLHMQELT